MIFRTMGQQHPNECIILFLKAPLIGKVKTRISVSLPEDIVLNIYKNMITDTFTNARKTGRPLLVFYYPENEKCQIEKWLKPSDACFHQEGKDLGEKMKNGFLKAFRKGFENAVLIGTDCPELTPDILENAFYGLSEKPSVLGPAADGGYYLIGFQKKHFEKNAFYNISWGENTVFEKTIAILTECNQSPFMLPVLRDMDTISDLKTYQDENRGKKDTHTLTYLSTLNL